ncbi:acyltransferase family protein [Butyrivibrio sp. MC2013]|uniref:acyltransferase family protein n=1 Tax=Butyrivibrio sp. MC2013 TaxID=1280686 RepID=UPI00047ECED5|nr:acyltransferase [Butyrivibrio sp. MC2013]
MKRVGYVDTFRGIGIILMIIGHVGFWGTFSYFFHAFHMPMFFFVTGYFWKKEEISSFISKRIRTLLLPYFVWTLFHFFIWLFVRSATDISVSEALFHIFLVNTTKVPLTGIWFLTALFIASLIYAMVCASTDNVYVQTVIIAIIALTGNLLPLLLPFRLPWAMDAGMVGAGFIHGGAILRDHKVRGRDLLDIRMIYIIPAAIIVTLLIFVNSEVNMRTGEYGIIPLFWINAFASIVVLWNICKAWNGRELKGVVGAADEEVRFIGRNSICYLCFNLSLLTLFQYLLSGLHMISHIKKLIIFAAILISIHLITIVLSGRLKCLIGKK